MVPGDIWFTILAGFDESEEELKDNMDWWYKDNNSGIFKLPIQAPDTVSDIWLFLSHDKIDLPKLQDAIKEEAEILSIVQVPFALVFSTVRDGKKFDAAKKSNNKQAKAIHVEVAREHALGAHTMFSDLYGSTSMTFSLDIWMRYVLTPSTSLTRQMQDGATTLRSKQVWVPDSIKHGQTWDILDLDSRIKDHKMSLRSMLMKIRSKEDKKPLFMSINEDKFGNGHLITFQPSKESEARDMIVQFGSYLIFEYSVGIVTSLTVAAATRAKAAAWDEENHCAKSPEDESLQQLVTLADGMDWLKNPQASAPVILKPPEQQKFSQQKNVTFNFNPDSSSIATFHPDKNKDTNQDAHDKDLARKATDMDISSDSSIESGTNDSTPAPHTQNDGEPKKKMSQWLARCVTTIMPHAIKMVRLGRLPLAWNPPCPLGRGGLS